MRLRSYRFALATWIGGFVLLLGLGLLAASWAVSSHAVRVLAEQQFREVSRRQVVETQARLRTAGPALDTLDALLSDGLDAASSDAVARAFLGVLQANPGFTWVSYGDEHGSFTGVYRAQDGKLRVNRSAIRDGKTELVEHEIAPDGTWREIRHETDTGYDPRTRPFYTLAKEAGHRVWTRPYVFYEQGIPGITCARPHYAKSGALLGVLTIDFDLNALSDFMRHADLSAHGLVFLFTPDGKLLAHPDVNVVTKTGAADKGTLLTLEDVHDPRMQAYRAELGREHEVVEIAGDEKLQNFRLKVDGEPYLASFTAFPVDLGLDWIVGAVAPESDFLGPVRVQTLALFGAMLGVLAAAVFLMANALSEKFARPLRALSAEMEKVGRLDLGDATLDPSDVKEIVAMQQALQGMKGGLRSFARFVPRDVVKRLVSSGREAVLGGRTQELTVFFSDVEGFTTIAESMAPDALVALLGEYLDEMTRAIAAHGGTVDKFLGDGILAFWGAPEDDAGHALHAVEAALDCAARLDEIAARGGFGGRILRTRIGIATGPVLVGNIGTPERLNYTVMGDTANLASRLEGLNKAYGTRILVSEETAKHLSQKILARAIDVVAVKGKSKGVRVYEPLGRPDKDGVSTKRIVALSDEALAGYLRRDFDNAAGAWAAVLELKPGDRAADVMRARAEAFRTKAPPPEWDGVMIAHEK